MKWTIEYDNRIGFGAQDFEEWWVVTDGERKFKCYDEADAEWLLKTLNKLP